MICDDASRSRVIHARAGVGATATVLQQEALRFSCLTIDQPTLIVVRRGIKTLTCGDAEWVVRSGEAALVSGGCRLDVANQPDTRSAYEANWLVWDTEVLSSFSFSAPPVADPARKLGRLEDGFVDAFVRAREVILDGGGVSLAIAQHRIKEILLWLDARGLNLFDTAGPTTFVERVRRILVADPSENWLAGDVAHRLATSEATLRRHLMAENTTFSDLLADIRMSHALALLQSTDYPIGHIALEVGYESASRFAIRFRKRFGFAPTAVRGHNRPGNSSSLSMAS